MNFVKRLVLMLLFVGIGLIVSACGDSPEQRKLNKEWVSSAKTQASAYIQEKYGFDAAITDAVQEREYQFLGSVPLQTVYVRMQHNDRHFGVYVDNDCCYDNYQADDIAAAIKAECEAVLPNVYETELRYGEVHTVYDPIELECVHMLHDYFDGTNLAEILAAGNGSSVFVKYINTDLSPLAETHSFDPYFTCSGDKFVFFSCRSEEAVKNVITSEGIYNNYLTAKNGIYADSRYVLTQDGGDYQSYELGSYDCFYYCVENGDPEDVQFKKITPDPDKLVSNEHYQTEFVSSAFSVHSDEECKVWIYYPTDQITRYSNETSFAFYDAESQKFDRKISTQITKLPYHTEELNITPEEDQTFVFIWAKYKG